MSAVPLLGQLLLARGLTGAGARVMHRRQRVPKAGVQARCPVGRRRDVREGGATTGWAMA